MNIEKANLKVLVANSIGADIEDRVEGEQKAAYEQAGAAEALRQAASKIPRDLSAKVDRSLKEGEIKESLEAMEVAALVKLYLSKVGVFLLHLAEVEHQKSTLQLGRVRGLKQAMEIVQTTRDQEVQKIKALEETALESGGDERLDLRTAGSAARNSCGSAADRKAASKGERPVPNRAAAEKSAREAHGRVAARRGSKSKKQGISKKPKKLRAVKKEPVSG